MEINDGYDIFSFGIEKVWKYCKWFLKVCVNHDIWKG